MKAIQDLLLTSQSSAYIPEGLVADQVLPVINSMQSTGKLAAYGTQHLRIESDIKGGRGKYPRVESITRSTSSYSIEGHGLEGMVTEDDYSNVQDPFDAELDETMGLTSKLALGKEKALADTLTDTAILTQNTTLSGTSQFNDYANSDPLAVFMAAKAAIKAGCGAIDNLVGIMSWEVANAIQYHPAFLQMLGYNYARPGGLNYDEIAKILGVKKLYVPRASFESAKEGQSSVLAPVWGKHIVLGVLPDSAAKYQISLGYMIKFANRPVRRVTKWNINNPAFSKAILVDDHYDMVVSNVGAGYLIKNAIA